MLIHIQTALRNRSRHNDKIILKEKKKIPLKEDDRIKATWNETFTGIRHFFPRFSPFE